MSASEHVRRERAELADLLDSTGPDAPTLCEGWSTRDLAAHMVVREARPDAALGVAGGPTAGWTQKVQEREAARDYADIVGRLRGGPPLLSVFSVPGLGGLMNLFEFVVHHDDVLRAQPDWQPRTIPVALEDELWRKLRLPASGALGRVPIGVTFIRSDTDEPLVVRKGTPSVAVRGSVLELVMLAFGRRAVNVEVAGDADAVASFRAAYLAAPSPA